MPEGDTVYRLARRLDGALRGKRLHAGELRVPAHATADLAGRTVLEHDTHGKHLLTRFDGGLTLHTHLRMTGSWSVVGAGRALPPKMWPDVRVRLVTEAGPTAFGMSLPVVQLLPTVEEAREIGHLGPDPLRVDWNADDAVARLCADPTRPLVAALLDQRLIAGLGNLWANELCFLGGYSPWTPIGDVDVDVDVGRCHRRPRAAAFSHRARCHADHDREHPARRAALGHRARRTAVPTLRHTGASARRGLRRPGTAAHLVVSGVSADQVTPTE